MAKLNIYGTTTPRITQLSCDRLGILNVTAEQTVLTEVEDIGNNLNKFATLHAAPNIGINIPCVGLQTPKFSDGQIIFAYLYEGFNGDPTTSEIVCEIEGCENQEPIETHPNILTLVKTYKGNPQPDGHVIFSLQAPAGVDAVPGPDGKARNPMAGVEDYITIGYTWRKQYITSQILQTVFTRAGFIDTPQTSQSFGLNQVPPPLQSPRNWLKLSPRCRWRGNCWEVTETWLASGRNGWVTAMYNSPA
jgi:hypothetical protein